MNEISSKIEAFPEKVFLVDDDDTLRRMLSRTFQSKGFEVQDFSSAEEFLNNYSPGTCECLVTDIEMPGMTGIELLDQITKKSPALPVIVVSGHSDIPTAIDAMHRGAFDFIEKPFSTISLINRVEKAMVANMEYILNYNQVSTLRSQLESLTPRENTILCFFGPGHPNKIIAHCLGISEKTVEFHRKNIFDKTGTKNQAELISKLALMRSCEGTKYGICSGMVTFQDIVNPLLNCPGAQLQDGCIVNNSNLNGDTNSIDGNASRITAAFVELCNFSDSCVHSKDNICVAKVLTTNVSLCTV